jgi:hypothetical protein
VSRFAPAALLGWTPEALARIAELRGWTYAKSQKARNLERDPRATLQVEARDTAQEPPPDEITPRPAQEEKHEERRRDNRVPPAGVGQKRAVQTSLLEFLDDVAN